MFSVFAHRAAPGRGDLGDDLLRGPGVGPFPGVAAAEVVDDDAGALLGEQQRVLAADAAPGAGDDGDAAFQCSHVMPP